MKIGNYDVIRSLGKGGMGEVFLVYDPVCQRSIALKKIRDDLAKHQTIKDRFLKEARIAAELVHPSIIPIYSITQDATGIYYTMPYVEGETLKERIREARQLAKAGKPIPENASVATLMRIFLNVCQAVAFAHAKGVIHRDLKPENIIIGKYGEVVILDWGLAQRVGETEEVEEIEMSKSSALTRPGKIVGTLTYMAPERGAGEPASKQTDIYALGVILYQILTLRIPFKRQTLEGFRKQMKHERLIDPEEAAPYRDIPKQLSNMVKQCLSSTKGERTQTMEELLKDLEGYIEGRPQWIASTELNIDQKEDWEFQENILLASLKDWVNLMVSKVSFQGNLKIETRVKLGKHSEGLGFLLNVAEASVRKHVEEGYCLWIGPLSQGSKLFRSETQVMHLPDAGLKTGVWHTLRIEKIDDHLHLYIDDALKLSYASQIPLWGNHLGFLLRDGDLEIEPLHIFIGSQSAMVNCLSIPDAFLANQHYPNALSEYRRISSCFPGHTEGREATFRAGITLLEQARTKKKKKERESLLDEALSEFEKLHAAPGAPLEYLGKSLVYKEQNEVEEEVKCLELALRKFPQHPLRDALVEHLLLRLYQTIFRTRKSGSLFALLALRQLPELMKAPEHQHLIAHIKKEIEAFPFLARENLPVALAFLLGKAAALEEMGAKIAVQPLPEASDLLERQDLSQAGDFRDFLQGCLIAGKEGEQQAVAFFSEIEGFDVPPLSELAIHFLTDKISLESRWYEEAFFFEKEQLFRQLILFYHCANAPERARLMQRKLQALLR
jgi:serine/threonine protein kinase/tetratricopeptide (TPR) repeat protein